MRGNARGCGRSVPPARPVATIRPRVDDASRSQSACASSMIVRRQQHGAALVAQSRGSPRAVRAGDCGSSPAVGSSRKRNSGSLTNASASASRCRCPPRANRRGVRFFREREPLEQRVRSAAPRVKRSEQPQRLARRDAVLQCRGLQRDADPRLTSSGSAPRRARRCRPSRRPAPQADQAFERWSSCPRRWGRAARRSRPPPRQR